MKPVDVSSPAENRETASLARSEGNKITYQIFESSLIKMLTIIVEFVLEYKV